VIWSSIRQSRGDCCSQLIDLRTQEFDLLLTLAEHKGLVLTREQLLEKPGLRLLRAIPYGRCAHRPSAP